MPAVNDNGEIVNFDVNNLFDSFNFKGKMTDQTRDDRTNNVKIMVQLRTLEMSLINCVINLISTRSENCVIVFTYAANQNVTFAITDTKLYVFVVILST